MSNRLNKISVLLAHYAKGRFDKRQSPSGKLDELDAVITGINMMGEELKAITISRNYFNNIFDSVSDMVFVLDARGRLLDLNRAVTEQLDYEKTELIGQRFSRLCGREPINFSSLKQQLRREKRLAYNEYNLCRKNGSLLPVKITLSSFSDEKRRSLILVSASDISYQVSTEKLIIRAIIDAQENERTRLAKDLHDSLTQQLSAVKFYVCSIRDGLPEKEAAHALQQSNKMLADLITEIRSICFNLMPRTIEEFGLMKAVREFCNSIAYSGNLSVRLHAEEGLPVFEADLSIDLYRVIQELIANAVRHGQASAVQIRFRQQNGLLQITVEDNGKGFDTATFRKGMGIRNIQSRIKSHDGAVVFSSTINTGTSWKISIPL